MSTRDHLVTTTSQNTNGISPNLQGFAFSDIEDPTSVPARRTLDLFQQEVELGRSVLPAYQLRVRADIIRLFLDQICLDQHLEGSELAG